VLAFAPFGLFPLPILREPRGARMAAGGTRRRARDGFVLGFAIGASAPFLAGVSWLYVAACASTAACPRCLPRLAIVLFCCLPRALSGAGGGFLFASPAQRAGRSHRPWCGAVRRRRLDCWRSGCAASLLDRLSLARDRLLPRRRRARSAGLCARARRVWRWRTGRLRRRPARLRAAWRRADFCANAGTGVQLLAIAALILLGGRRRPARAGEWTHPVRRAAQPSALLQGTFRTEPEVAAAAPRRCRCGRLPASWRATPSPRRMRGAGRAARDTAAADARPACPRGYLAELFAQPAAAAAGCSGDGRRAPRRARAATTNSCRSASAPRPRAGTTAKQPPGALRRISRHRLFAWFYQLALQIPMSELQTPGAARSAAAGPGGAAACGAQHLLRGPLRRRSSSAPCPRRRCCSIISNTRLVRRLARAAAAPADRPRCVRSRPAAPMLRATNTGMTAVVRPGWPRRPRAAGLRARARCVARRAGLRSGAYALCHAGAMTAALLLLAGAACSPDRFTPQCTLTRAA
jgi:hypothetical protein